MSGLRQQRRCVQETAGIEGYCQLNFLADAKSYSDKIKSTWVIGSIYDHGY
jgi:hypothetical protein